MVWKLSPSPINEPQGTDRGSKTVSGRRLNHQLLSLKLGRQTARAGHPQPGQEGRVPRAPEIKIGVLLGRSPADKQVLVTRAFGVVPSGLSLRGPDLSLLMRLLTVSDKTADSNRFESMAVGLSDSLG